MKSNVKTLEPGKVRIECEVDPKDWKAAQEKAFRKLAAKVVVPGFRAGKAPEAMLRARVDGNRIINGALDEILSPTYGAAIRDNKLKPMYQPSVDVLKISDTDLSVAFEVTLVPEVTLGQYKGLHAEKKTAEVKDEDVAAAIQKRLEGNADLVLVEREAKLGDTVTIDFEGFIDGVPFEGGKADNYVLVLGSNSFVPGFEEGLVGVKPGEEKDVNITFPEQYVAELAGKPATFKVKLHEVKEKVIPTLSDEAVKDLGLPEVETVEALNEYERKNLLAQKEDDCQREYYGAIVRQILDNASVTISPAIVEAEVKHQEETTRQQIESNGLTFQQYLEITGQTEEKLRESFREGASANLKSFLVMEELCIKENLLVSDAELDFEVSKLADQYKMKPEDVKKALGNLDGYRDNLRQKKLQDFILANND